MVSPDTQSFRSGPFSLRVESEQRTVRLRLRGELDLATADLLRDALRDALAGTHEEVIVDLTELSFIDSTGIAILIGAIADGEGVVKFSPSEAPGVARVLRLTGVDARMPRAD